jgi:Dyp-type peroxidase family
MTEEPVLAMEDIQGNVLSGFNKSYQCLLGFKFASENGSVLRAKRWLRDVMPLITPLSQSYASKLRVREFRLRAKGDPEDLRDKFFSVAFSYPGISKLTDQSGGFSQAFQDGQWHRAASLLGDPIKGDRGGLSSWKVGRDKSSTPDIFAICAADRLEDLVELREVVLAHAASARLERIYQEDGHDLPPGPNGTTGREHFGFKDLIARIRVRGRKSHASGDYFSPRKAGIPQDPVLPEFAAPGEVLVWPGQFVLGYERQSTTDTRSSLPAIEPQPYWARNGSYLVFRRLTQDVMAFRRFVQHVREQLAKDPAYGSITEEQVSAMFVGRWPNGTPLEVSPASSTPPNPTNDFEYLKDNWPPGSNSQPDVLGTRCPVSAHIRKVNPRDQGSDLGPSADNMCRSLLRRGIPFGDPLAPDAEPNSEPTRQERGLLFISYQASIEETFETLTQDWMNSTAGPTAPQGFDMLVGKNPDGGDRFCSFGKNQISTDQAFVYASGGCYFFTPSISAIRNVLSVD